MEAPPAVATILKTTPQVGSGHKRRSKALLLSLDLAFLSAYIPGTASPLAFAPARPFAR